MKKLTHMVLAGLILALPASAQVKKPNILIIWGDDIGSHEDMLPTLLAASGDTSVKEDLLKGRKVGNMNYKVHIDCYNLSKVMEAITAGAKGSGN